MTSFPSRDAFEARYVTTTMNGSGDIRRLARTDAEWLLFADAKVAADARGIATSILLNMGMARRHDALLDVLTEHEIGTSLDVATDKVTSLGTLLNERLSTFAARLADTEVRYIVSVIADDLCDAAVFNGRVDVESEPQDDWSDASHVDAVLVVLAAWAEMNAPIFQ